MAIRANTVTTRDSSWLFYTIAYTIVVGGTVSWIIPRVEALQQIPLFAYVIVGAVLGFVPDRRFNDLTNAYDMRWTSFISYGLFNALATFVTTIIPIAELTFVVYIVAQVVALIFDVFVWKPNTSQSWEVS